MSITIEKAKKEDTPFLAEMILKSSRADKRIGLFDYLFADYDDAYLQEKLQALVISSKHPYCHFENFLVARVAGKAVGSLCSYEPRVATKERFVEALSEIGCDEAVIARLERLRPCDFEIDNKTLMFDFLEEVEGYIDVGILKALTQKSLLSARLKGYRIAQAIVEIGAFESVMFYEKLGFRQKERRECEVYQEIFGRTGVMLLALEF